MSATAENQPFDPFFLIGINREGGRDGGMEISYGYLLVPLRSNASGNKRHHLENLDTLVLRNHGMIRYVSHVDDVEEEPYSADLLDDPELSGKHLY